MLPKLSMATVTLYTDPAYLGLIKTSQRMPPMDAMWKCYITPAFSGVPNKGGQNQNSKPPLRVTMMPLGAPSISKYGSLVRPDAQIVALRAHCA